MIYVNIIYLNYFSVNGKQASTEYKVNIPHQAAPLQFLCFSLPLACQNICQAERERVA